MSAWPLQKEIMLSSRMFRSTCIKGQIASIEVTLLQQGLLIHFQIIFKVEVLPEHQVLYAEWIEGALKDLQNLACQLFCQERILFQTV
jgi:hypothetical protein